MVCRKAWVWRALALMVFAGILGGCAGWDGGGQYQRQERDGGDGGGGY